MQKELEDLIIKEIPQDDSSSREEKLLLMDLIRENKPKVIVEIGTHRGLTTCYMGVAAKEVDAHIYTYDPYDWGARGNCGKFIDLPITCFEKKGIECEVENIDFLFVDGFHERDYVNEEIKHFLPRLNDRAIVVFHDTNGSNASCDVPGAIEDWGLKVEYIKTENGLMIYHHAKN